MKSVFVLWSAGVDSTYLILRLLENGYKVRAGYIDIRNNHDKTKMELYAINRLQTRIRKLFPHFQYDGVIYIAKNNFTSTKGIKYRQVPYFINGLLVAPITDLRALGYVQGDSIIKNLEKVRAIYNSYNLINNQTLPQLVFPLKNISKVKIFNYMNDRYESILFDCVWCPNPLGSNFIPCGECSTCRRRNTELIEANKITMERLLSAA